MRENSIDELREFFASLKDKYNGRVRALQREQVCIEADVGNLKNTDAVSIDRIMEAIKHFL